MRRWFILWVLSLSPLAYAGGLPMISTDRLRYFEGETIHCQLRSTASHVATWSVLGKELQRKTVRGDEDLSIEAPVGLRAVVPLELSVGGEKTRVSIFPRDVHYWVGDKEFDSKTILVEKSAATITPELDALGIPYILETGRDLQKLKRVDIRLTEADLKGLDRSDPWTRWELVQIIRKRFAKDLEGPLSKT